MDMDHYHAFAQGVVASYRPIVPPFHGSPISSASVRTRPTLIGPPSSGVSSLRSLFNMFYVYGGDEVNIPFETDHFFD